MKHELQFAQLSILPVLLIECILWNNVISGFLKVTTLVPVGLLLCWAYSLNSYVSLLLESMFPGKWIFFCALLFHLLEKQSCILLLHRIFSLFRNFKLVIDVACMKYIEILLRWSIVKTDDQMQIMFGVQSGETHGWSSNRFLFQQMIRDDNLFAGSLQRLDCKRRFWSKGLCPEQQQIKSTPPWSPDTGGGWWFGLGC